MCQAIRRVEEALDIINAEKTLESPLDFKEIQPVHSEGDQPRDFFGRNGANAETPVLWPPHGWCPQFQFNTMVFILAYP